MVSLFSYQDRSQTSRSCAEQGIERETESTREGPDGWDPTAAWTNREEECVQTSREDKMQQICSRMK